MEQKGELISYRPDIKVVDCTIRDGGLVNNFYFDDEFVRNLYTANVAAGVEYMEFVIRLQRKFLTLRNSASGSFVMSRISVILSVITTPIKVSVMADVGRTDYKKILFQRQTA